MKTINIKVSELLEMCEDKDSIKSINEFLSNWVDENCDVETKFGCGINQIDQTDVEIFSSNCLVRLELDRPIYAKTQLTIYTIFVRLCARLGVHLDIVYNEEEIDMF